MTLSNNDKPIGVLSLKQKGTKFVVKFDNDLELTFTEDQIVMYRISLDKRFTEAELDKIQKEATIDQWYSKCLGYIAYKLRTKKEIWTYLSTKSDLDDKEKNKIISKLLKNNYLNDLEYAKCYLEDCKNKNRGKRYFINHLQSLGVDQTIIYQVLLEFDEEAMLENLIVKYQKEELRLINYPIIIQKHKLTEKMARNGISMDTINKVISNINFSEDLSVSFIKDVEKIKSKTNDVSKQTAYLLNKGYSYQKIKEYIKEN